MAPVAYIRDLWEAFQNYLDKSVGETRGYNTLNYEYLYIKMFICRINRLTWHQGTIPEDEIWVKIGWDKGGGSFKMSFQVANISTPNSPENTIVFLMYEGPDSYANLSITLQRFIDQIGALQEKQWRYTYMYLHNNITCEIYT